MSLLKVKVIIQRIAGMTEYRTVLYVVGVILVEIRASEKVEKSRVLADVIHNVTAKIVLGKPEAEIMQDVISRAERLGIEKAVSRYFELAEKSRSSL
jgi:hypothetical protein